ncbi:MAG: hypothetical protein E7658_07850 [Ruminococcaceae bacterium]|nr:hypothetical protein [Oscillospiraceae bacterium]
MWEILYKITIAFFATYGFYSVLEELKNLARQWYLRTNEKKKKKENRTINQKNIFSDAIDKETEK